MELKWEAVKNKVKVRAAAVLLDFRSLLSPDFMIRTAVRGGNPETKANAAAPIVPKSPPPLPPKRCKNICHPPKGRGRQRGHYSAALIVQTSED